jgi:FAD/FMN-containing dehydrogenase
MSRPDALVRGFGDGFYAHPRRTEDGMSTTTDTQLSTLRASLNGKVIGADDPGYDDSRRVFFTGFDRRPAAIARAVDTSDVARVIAVARETGAELAVRSGGHSRAGHGASEGGIVLDLSAMNAVTIDSDGRAAWAQAGVTAGDYTTATGEHGRATGLGDTPTVGLGGIALGGGIGFFVRKHGLAIDDLLAAEVVTADGDLLEVDEERHPDLFWALRGGGGNFGVATRLRLRLHEVDQVVGGMLLLPASADVITELVAAAEAAPEELSIIANILNAPPAAVRPGRAPREADGDGADGLRGRRCGRRAGDRADSRTRDPARRHGAADALPGDVRGTGEPPAGLRRGHERAGRWPACTSRRDDSGAPRDRHDYSTGCGSAARPRWRDGPCPR